MRHQTEHKTFEEPDGTREFPNGKTELLSIAGAEVGRMTFQPGQTTSCRSPGPAAARCRTSHTTSVVSSRSARTTAPR
jgi:hypothetical protein